MVAAPLLTRLYLGDGAGPANPQLATAFAWLLLPQIFFYGVGALLGAMLNTRGVFGPFAWAPVLNNVVVLAVLGVFVAVPGRISLDPVQLSDPKLLVLGIGTTLGIVAQALVLIPAVRRTGFRYRPTVGLGPAARRDRRARRVGRRIRPDRAGRLHRHDPRRRRRGTGQRRDLLQRLAAAPGAVRRPRRLAAHRADAADEPGRGRGPHRRRRRRSRPRHAAVRGRAAAGQRTADAVRHRSSAWPCSPSARDRPARARPGWARRWRRPRSACCRSR